VGGSGNGRNRKAANCLEFPPFKAWGVVKKRQPGKKKLLREQPVMTAEAIEAMQPRMEKIVNTVMNEADKMANEAATKPANSVKD
jgi:hypothetical protein